MKRVYIRYGVKNTHFLGWTRISLVQICANFECSCFLTRLVILDQFIKELIVYYVSQVTFRKVAWVKKAFMFFVNIFIMDSNDNRVRFLWLSLWVCSSVRKKKRVTVISVLWSWSVCFIIVDDDVLIDYFVWIVIIIVINCMVGGQNIMSKELGGLTVLERFESRLVSVS